MKKAKFGWANLIIGLLLIILGFVSVLQPESNLISLALLFGVVAIVKGVLDIFEAQEYKQLTGSKVTGLTFLGILDVILGILLISNYNITAATLPFIFSIWFIVDSFVGLFRFDILGSRASGHYIINLILSIFGIILGFMLLFNPLTAALTLSFMISFYFFIFGLMNIFIAFSHANYFK